MCNRESMDMIVCLCKDIARHASQLEAESQGVEQSTDRYLELKALLLSHYLQREDNFDTIRKELRKSMCNTGDVDKNGKAVTSPLNHLLCMFEYFLMLVSEEKKCDCE